MEIINETTALVLFIGLASLAAVLATRIARFASIPAPAIFLLGGTIAATIWEQNGNTSAALSLSQIAHIGTVALIIVLYQGGFAGGLTRARQAWAPIMWLGLPGTILTTAMIWGVARLLGLDSGPALLVAIAVAPTDPAAVFSVLGGGGLRGRSGIILEGESGANDPVGIALMLGALTYLAGDGSVTHVAWTIVEELLIGAVVGGVLGKVLGRLLQASRLGKGAMAALGGLSGAFVIYAIAAMLHGSGFLAVFIAGMIVGDHEVHDDPTPGNVLGFGAVLAEIVMFSALGLTISLTQFTAYSIGISVAIFLALTFIARPLVAIAPLGFSDLRMGERVFISWGGLKGAVPILLAEFALLEHADHGELVYKVVFVTVAASIFIQGATLPWLARRVGIVSAGGDVDGQVAAGAAGE